MHSLIFFHFFLQPFFCTGKERSTSVDWWNYRHLSQHIYSQGYDGDKQAGSTRDSHGNSYFMTGDHLTACSPEDVEAQSDCWCTTKIVWAADGRGVAGGIPLCQRYPPFQMACQPSGATTLKVCACHFIILNDGLRLEVGNFHQALRLQDYLKSCGLSQLLKKINEWVIHSVKLPCF